MATLATSALITVEEYHNMDGKSPVDVDVHEAQYILHINGVSYAIENYCRRTICPVTSCNELFEGDGEKFYRVRHKKINETPTLYYWDGQSWQEMTTSEYPWSYDGDIGKIYFTQGGLFQAGTEYKITYSCGYARASVPQDIKLACYLMVHRSLKRVEREGIVSESFGDQTLSVDLSYFPADVTRLLNPYRFMGY